MKKISAVLLVSLFSLAIHCRKENREQKVRITFPADLKEERPVFSVLGDLGYIVVRSRDGAVMSWYQPRETFLPASTSKIFTMAALLHDLPPEMKFTTDLLMDGEIDEKGVLQGDLMLRGGGDPSLKVSHMTIFASALKDRGIRRVNGRFLVDDSYFPAVEKITDSMAEDSNYNQALNALSINQNQISLWWNFSRNGYQVEVHPVLEHIRFVTGGGSPDGRHMSFLKTSPASEEIWQIPGSYRQTARQRNLMLPIRKPQIAAAEILRNMARKNGLEIPAPVLGRLNSSGEILYSQSSPELQSLAETTLDYSSNLLAETLLLQWAKAREYRVNDHHQAAAYLQKYYENLTEDPAIWKNFHLDNGSGLTTTSKVSPLQLAAALKWARDLKVENRPFSTFLPISGSKGTMAGRLSGGDFPYRVFAKTGSVDYAVSLAGYFLGQNGEEYIFVIFIWDKQKRDYINLNRNDYSISLRREAGRWHARNKALIDQLLAQWMMKL